MYKGKYVDKYDGVWNIIRITDDILVEEENVTFIKGI